MKSVFGFDVTDDKNSEKSYAELFLSKKLSESTTSELDEKRESLETTVNNAKLPIALSVIMWLGLFWALIVLNGFLKSEVSFAQGIRNAPMLFITGLIAGIASAILFLAAHIKKKRVLNQEDAEGKIEMLDVMADKAFAELEVPRSAIPTDILLFRFAIKDGKFKVKESGFSATPYVNHEMRAYLKDFNLCLADVEDVYAFPLESLKRISTVKKRIILPAWNKEEAYNKGVYKQYKISSNQYGVSVKSYHILELEKDGEQYGIYFPSYELPTFESLTLMHAESADDKAEEEE